MKKIPLVKMLIEFGSCKAVIEELHKDIDEPYNLEEEMEQLVEQFTRIRMKHDPFFFFATFIEHTSDGFCCVLNLSDNKRVETFLPHELQPKEVHLDNRRTSPLSCFQKNETDRAILFSSLLQPPE